MAFAPGRHHAPAFSVGIDVMKTQIPARDTLEQFIEVFDEQVSPTCFFLPSQNTDWDYPISLTLVNTT